MSYNPGIISSKKLRIVHLEEFMHPDAGYQINLLSKSQALLGYDVHVVTADLNGFPNDINQFFGKENIGASDAQFFKDTGVHIWRLPMIGYYSGRVVFNPVKLVRSVLNLKPDVLYVHGEDTLSGIIFILVSRWLHFPLVLDCHMLEMASRNRLRHVFRFFYRLAISPIIVKRGIPLIRVVDTDYVEKCLGVPLSHTYLLSLGTDMAYFKPSSEAKRLVRNKLGIDESEFVVVYAGKLDIEKGGKFLSGALREKLPGFIGTKIKFLIIGNMVGEYGEGVRNEFLESENHIIILPTQKYSDLAQYYQASDLAIYPRQCSLSFFDVQASGLPVLFEENEINSQRCKNGNAFTFQPNSEESLREKILWFFSLSSDQISQMSLKAIHTAKTDYDFDRVAPKYNEVLHDAVVKWADRKT